MLKRIRGPWQEKRCVYNERIRASWSEAADYKSKRNYLKNEKTIFDVTKCPVYVRGPQALKVLVGHVRLWE